MRTAASTTISLVFVLALSLQAQTNNQTAIDEAVRRQAVTIEMENELKIANAAKRQNDIQNAAAIYQQAASRFPQTQVGNPKVDAEKKEIIAGLDDTRETLARQFLKRGELVLAGDQVNYALMYDPANAKLRSLKTEIDQAAAMQAGRVPSPDMIARIPGIQKTNIDAATLVQNGRLLYEMGQLDEAEKVLLQVLDIQPANTAAPYYLDLLKEARYMNDARDRERDTKSELELVERTWLISTSAQRLPVPNRYATNDDVNTGRGRQIVSRKLQDIKLPQMPGTFGEDLEKGLPLSAVLRNLKGISSTNDIEKVGVNFLFNPHSGGSAAAAAAVDVTALPAAAPSVDADGIQIKINPALDNLTLKELLDAICLVADHAISYSVVDYGVEFFVKPLEMAMMEERNFHVDPNTFMQGMANVQKQYITGTGGTTGGFGGGGYGGGGYGGGGYGGGGYGGGGYGGGGYGGGGYGGGGYGGGGYGGGMGGGMGGYGGGGYGGGMMGGYGGGMGGYGGGMGGYGGGMGGYGGGMGGYGGGMGGYGGGMGGYGGGMGGYGGGMMGGYGGGMGGGGSPDPPGTVSYPVVSSVGIPYVTTQTPTSMASWSVTNFFAAIGIDLSAGVDTNTGRLNGRFVVFNERTGDLLIRATVDQLDIVERVIELLNKSPQEVQIDAKFVSVDQVDSKGLNFGWYLGNMSLNNGSVGVTGGTAPSYQGPPSVNNPSGIFPGPGALGANTGQQTPQASDGVVTTGLRAIAPGAPSGATAPSTLATITGIMTDPQFRMTINAIEQRAGSDLLAAPRVTTESGRQAHVAVNDIISIVTGVTLPPATSTTITTGLSGAAASSTALNQASYTTMPFTTGPALDILPTICADGYSIQMVLIPSLVEFVQYDPPNQFIPQSQVATLAAAGQTVTAALPLPRFRVRQVVTAANVWDGQTIMLGGLISETIAKVKDKVPVLGDLPLLGRLFQSVYSYSDKENVMIFVTATIIDPAGNRIHTDDQMPFAKNSIPPQPTAAQ